MDIIANTSTISTFTSWNSEYFGMQLMNPSSFSSSFSISETSMLLIIGDFVGTLVILSPVWTCPHGLLRHTPHPGFQELLGLHRFAGQLAHAQQGIGQPGTPGVDALVVVGTLEVAADQVLESEKALRYREPPPNEATKHLRSAFPTSPVLHKHLKPTTPMRNWRGRNQENLTCDWCCWYMLIWILVPLKTQHCTIYIGPQGRKKPGWSPNEFAVLCRSQLSSR